MTLDNIPKTNLRVEGTAGNRSPGAVCIHCGRSDFHLQGCIVARSIEREARETMFQTVSQSPAIRPPMAHQTRFVNVGTKVMQGDHCAAVACSANMAHTIAIALNNRREARRKS